MSRDGMTEQWPDGTTPQPHFRQYRYRPYRRSLIVVGLLIMALQPFTGRSQAAAMPITVTDDNGRQLTLTASPQRIVSLSPNITEILFDLGAGSRIIGTIDQSNHPDEARQIVRIGDHHGVDIEAIVSLKPDLIISWPSGNLPRQLQTLERLGLTLYASDAQRLKDIPRTIQNLGRLTGTDERATELAGEFQRRLQSLQDRYRDRPTVSVFVQIWAKPLMTVNDQQLISDVIHLCGGRNVFGDLTTLTPRVSTEAVLQANPDVIISTSENGDDPLSLHDWHRWPTLKATQDGRLYGIDPNIISSPTPRILDGAERMCRLLERSRKPSASQ